MFRFLILIILLSCITAYSEELQKPAINLSGEWSGTKQELGYMTLTHKDEGITGQICEVKDHDCMDIQGAKLKGSVLTFYYLFKDDNDQKRVDVELELSADGNSLSGKATIKDSGIEVKLILSRPKN